MRQSRNYFKYCTFDLWLNRSCRCSARVRQRKYDKTKRTEREKKKRKRNLTHIGLVLECELTGWPVAVEVSGPLTAVQTVPGTAVLGAAEPEETLTLDSVVFPKHFTVVMHFLILLYVDHGTKETLEFNISGYMKLQIFNFGYECASDLISFSVDQK